jgi:hypothetical protein
MRVTIWSGSCRDQFDTLYREGEKSGHMMCIALHPLYVRKPHRISALAEVFDYIFAHSAGWLAYRGRNRGSLPEHKLRRDNRASILVSTWCRKLLSQRCDDRDEGDAVLRRVVADRLRPHAGRTSNTRW